MLAGVFSTLTKKGDLMSGPGGDGGASGCLGRVKIALGWAADTGAGGTPWPGSPQNPYPTGNPSGGYPAGLDLPQLPPWSGPTPLPNPGAGSTPPGGYVPCYDPPTIPGGDSAGTDLPNTKITVEATTLSVISGQCPNEPCNVQAVIKVVIRNGNLVNPKQSTGTPLPPMGSTGLPNGASRDWASNAGVTTVPTSIAALPPEAGDGPNDHRCQVTCVVTQCNFRKVVSVQVAGPGGLPYALRALAVGYHLVLAVTAECDACS